MEEEKKQDGTHKSLGGSEERRGLHIQGSSSLGGSSVGREREPCSLWEENTATSVKDRVRPVHRVLTPALPTQPERVSSSADKDWVLERGVWRADPGKGLWLAMRRHHEGNGREREALQMGCLWRKPEPQEAERRC